MSLPGFRLTPKTFHGVDRSLTFPKTWADTAAPTTRNQRVCYDYGAETAGVRDA